MGNYEDRGTRQWDSGGDGILQPLHLIAQVKKGTLYPSPLKQLELWRGEEGGQCLQLPAFHSSVTQKCLSVRMCKFLFRRRLCPGLLQPAYLALQADMLDLATTCKVMSDIAKINTLGSHSACNSNLICTQMIVPCKLKAKNFHSICLKKACTFWLFQNTVHLTHCLLSGLKKCLVIFKNYMYIIYIIYIYIYHILNFFHYSKVAGVIICLKWADPLKAQKQ